MIVNTNLNWTSVNLTASHIQIDHTSPVWRDPEKYFEMLRYSDGFLSVSSILFSLTIDLGNIDYYPYRNHGYYGTPSVAVNCNLDGTGNVEFTDLEIRKETTVMDYCNCGIPHYPDCWSCPGLCNVFEPHMCTTLGLTESAKKDVVPENVRLHSDITNEIHELYVCKNKDYGDSFHDTFFEEGFSMARVRLSDKLNRFKTLTRTPTEQRIRDEAVRDTLIDLANYAIMTVMEIDRSKKNKDHNKK